MISPLEVIQSVLWVYLLIAAGALARRTGALAQEYDEGIMKVCYMIMIPCFILDKILGAEVLRDGWVVVSSIACGYGLIVAGVSVGYVVGKLAGLSKGNGMRTFALSSGTQNYGFTAAPVVESLWASSAVAVLFVHNIGVELAMWSFGVMVINGRSGFKWKLLANGMVIGVLIGLALVAANLDGYVTGVPRQAMKMLGAGAFPLAVFIVGASMMSMISHEKPSPRVLGAAAFTRFLAIPAVFLCAAKFLPIAAELKQVIVVQASMPAAVSPIILAKLYNGRPAIAVHIVVMTTILSLLTLPWIIAFACWWIGLEPML
ncbi:MAG: AEC family transporter [Akkermansiaceae bacterium]|nr:AEC family transporter [Akkermansiaceae bacterium]